MPPEIRSTRLTRSRSNFKLWGAENCIENFRGRVSTSHGVLLALESQRNCRVPGLSHRAPRTRGIGVVEFNRRVSSESEFGSSSISAGDSQSRAKVHGLHETLANSGIAVQLEVGALRTFHSRVSEERKSRRVLFLFSLMLSVATCFPNPCLPLAAARSESLISYLFR